ncbi:MAG: alpha/beta fold hydrolase, partial [Pseudonocardia sp.]|nr:alpha/beta fold hydrolase [Pseudonocardia sp.]
MSGRDASYEVHEIPDFTLECGLTLRPARVAYQTYGELNAEKSNAIVYPTWYSGRHWDNEWLIGEGMALDPARWFVIVPNMLGNGLSSSSSNTPPPWDRARFPRITVRDNVESQYRLVRDVFGISTLPLVLGWSMGAGQTYQWAASHPEMVQRMLPFCGSPRTAPHNQVFLDSLRAALSASVGFDGGWYPPDRWPAGGLRAFARIYAGWGFSQAFYWDECWRELGFTSLEDFVVGFWEDFFLDDRDPGNLLTMLDTWWNGDVGTTPGFSSTEEALGSIRAKAIVMPAEKDLYFPPEDERWAVSHMRDAELRVIPGVWGHFAGGGKNPTDTAFIDRAVAELLAA